MSWLQAFAICPAPTGPRWITREAIASSTGRARSTAEASPPTITERLPAAAAIVPPDTGASRYATSRRASSAATWRARPGSIVEVSRTTRPGRPPVAMPSGPSVTLSTAAASGSDSTTTSTSDASAATDAARRAPALASAASAGSAEIAHHDRRQAARRQRLRHRAAHRPEADHADGDRHHSKRAVRAPMRPKSTDTVSPGAQKQCPVHVPVLTISPASIPRPCPRSQLTSQVSDVSGCPIAARP